MEYVVIAFRSRSHTVAFSEFLRRNGINNEIINTPKEAGVGCGLSVKINKSNYTASKNAIRLSNKFSSLAGFFLINEIAGRKIIRII